MAHCTQCGKVLGSGTSFCNHCGAALVDKTQSKSKKPPVPVLNSTTPSFVKVDEQARIKVRQLSWCDCQGGGKGAV